MKKLIIDVNSLRHNIEQIKKYTSQNGKDDNGNLVKIIAVVKSNGYGLEIVEYTKFLIDNGISMFAVATIEEALKLRNAGIKQDILMLSSTAIEEDLRKLIDNNIIITIGSKEDIEIAEKIAKDKIIRAHLKIDTGFGRYGFVYTQKEEMVESLKNLKNIKIEGTFSHFSVSFFNDKYTKTQFDRFIDTVETLKLNKIETGILHICNSSAFVKFPNMHLNAVRIGSAFTGRLAFKNNLGLRKIGYLEANVAEIKVLPPKFNIGYSNAYTTKNQTKVAIIPVGYSDGINIVNDRDMFRKIDQLRYVVRDAKDFFKKKAFYVEINGQKCEVLGRIGTYHITVDITNKEVTIGDTVKIEINPKFINSDIRREYI